ncbi:MAG: hypothetical protein QXH45_00420 [Thermosphaera sp.]
MKKLFSNSSLVLKNRARVFSIVVTIAFIALFAVGAFYLSESYRVQPYVVHKDVFKTAELSSQVGYNVYVKPSLIYDYAGVVNYSTIYLSLADSIDYFFNISWFVSNSTSYGYVEKLEPFVRPALSISTSSWSKNFTIEPDVNASGNTISVKGAFNISDITDLVEAIDSEIRVTSWRFDAVITIEVGVNVAYSSGFRTTYVLKPLITLSFNRIYNLLSITTEGLSNTYSVENQRTVENTISLPLGIRARVSTVRSLAAISTLISGALLMALTYATLRVYGVTGLRNGRVRWKSVKGRLEEYRFRTIVIEDPADFEALSKRFDVPIVYSDSEKKYYLVIGDTAYVYAEKTS